MEGGIVTFKVFRMRNSKSAHALRFCFYMLTAVLLAAQSGSYALAE